MWYTILLFAALLGFILCGLIHISKRLRHEQEVNKGIYQKEAGSRLEEPKTSSEKLIEEIGKDTTLTSWDLDDIDRMHESHMNF